MLANTVSESGSLGLYLIDHSLCWILPSSWGFLIVNIRFIQYLSWKNTEKIRCRRAKGEVALFESLKYWRAPDPSLHWLTIFNEICFLLRFNWVVYHVYWTTSVRDIESWDRCVIWIDRMVVMFDRSVIGVDIIHRSVPVADGISSKEGQETHQNSAPPPDSQKLD